MTPLLRKSRGMVEVYYDDPAAKPATELRTNICLPLLG